jgi:ABC-type multidrug transport system fused ATPase/permease subunit
MVPANLHYQITVAFYDVQEGSVKVGGKDVRTWIPQELRNRIGVVPGLC